LREEIVINQTAALRRLLADEAFIHLPVAYDALGRTPDREHWVSNRPMWAVFVTGGSPLHLRAAADLG